MPKFEDCKVGYLDLWSCVAIDEGRSGNVDAMARKVLAGKDKYLAVKAATGVPWWFVGVLHARESSCDFSTHLHNGDPLTDRTTHVPAGRPAKGNPPFTWVASAIDALRMKGLNNVQSWPIERVCYEAERYNGFGYRKPGMPNSPYLWAGTNQYSKGKYVADHEYSAKAVDKQSGCMAVLKRLSEIDPSFSLAPEPEAPPAVIVAAKSRTVWSVVIGGACALYEKALSGADWIFGVLPDAQSETTQRLSTLDQVSSTLHINIAGVLSILSVAFLASAVLRHVDLKKLKEQWT